MYRYLLTQAKRGNDGEPSSRMSQSVKISSLAMTMAGAENSYSVASPRFKRGAMTFRQISQISGTSAYRFVDVPRRALEGWSSLRVKVRPGKHSAISFQSILSCCLLAPL